MNVGVAIQHLHIQGDVRQKNNFLASLDSQSWHGEDSEKIIFIKKIQAIGHWWELAQNISQQANTLVGAAQNSTENNSDEVVVFTSAAILSAQLMCDLLVGKTTWYGQAWLKQHELKPSLSALLLHHIFDLPAVIENLLNKNKFGLVCEQLSADEWAVVLQRLLALAKHSYIFNPDALDLNDIASARALPKKSIQWLNCVSSDIDIKKYSAQKRVLLLNCITFLSVWKFAPHQLQKQTYYALWSAQVYALLFIPDHGPVDIEKSEENTADERHVDNNFLEGDGVVEIYIDREDVSVLNHEGEVKEINNQTSHITAVKKSYNVTELEQNNISLLSLPDINTFVTPYGGVFFLINCLNSSQLEEINQLSSAIDSPEKTVDSPKTSLASPISPWVFIFSLAKKISVIHHVELDKPLEYLFANLAQLTLEELSSVIKLDSVSLLSEKICQYLQHKLMPLDLWSLELISARARVVLDNAYIHLYFDSSLVRLNIRRAGLDINPGWVPWLGRVIYFHYGAYPELMYEGDNQ
jgi:hypothetical protein